MAVVISILFAKYRLVSEVLGILNFGILNITRKSRNFHAFTQAYLAHAQTNFPAAICIYIYVNHLN